MSKLPIAAITGGAQGIGRALALGFAAAGYDVWIADPHQQAGEETVALIREAGGSAHCHTIDISEEADAQRWLQEAADAGQLSVMINNAGIGKGGSPLTLPLEHFDEVIRVNLRGTFLCARIAAQHMEAAGGGSIINIASTRAMMSEADTEAYAASKGGIVALTHALAISLGPVGIRVNAVSPGWIETGDWRYSPDVQPVQHSDADRRQHPVGRVGVPEDIVAACLYLSSDKSGFITGQNLVIDGGMTRKMIYE